MKPAWRLTVANTGLVLLSLTLAGLALFVGHRFRYEADWTSTGRNSLAAPSVAIVRTLHDPVRIEAFANRGPLRTAIRRLIDRYRRVDPAISLRFISPNRHPARVRRDKISFNGELIVHYDHRRGTVLSASQSGVTNMLARLSRTGARTIVFLTGNGERSPASPAGFGLSTWARALTARGFTIKGFDIDHGMPPAGPGTVLVITDPRTPFLAGEARLLDRYVKSGGNLLWLLEPNHVDGLARLAHALGLSIPPGFVVDPTSTLLTGAGPNFIVIDHYPAIGAVRGMHLITVFPTTTALDIQRPTPFHAVAILRTASDAWQQQAPLSAVVVPPTGIRQQALTIGVALRAHPDGHHQRIIVIGDSDFASNAFIGDGGNLTLAMNIANWAAYDDAFINLPNRRSPDLTLTLTQDALEIIAFGFLLVLPALLIGSGVAVWWRRRSR
ncbi:MAG: GldG family protein [Acidiferrobacter sp.]